MGNWVSYFTIIMLHIPYTWSYPISLLLCCIYRIHEAILLHYYYVAYTVYMKLSYCTIIMLHIPYTWSYPIALLLCCIYRIHETKPWQTCCSKAHIHNWGSTEKRKTYNERSCIVHPICTPCLKISLNGIYKCHQFLHVIYNPVIGVHVDGRHFGFMHEYSDQFWIIF